MKKTSYSSRYNSTRFALDNQGKTYKATNKLKNCRLEASEIKGGTT